MNVIRAVSDDSERASTTSIASRPSTIRPIRIAFATVPGPMRAPSAQASTSTTTAIAMFAVPNDSDVCSETP